MTKKLIAAAIAATLTIAPAAHANDLLKGAVGVAIGAGIYCGVTGKCQKQRAAPQRSGQSSAQRNENRSVQTALNTFGFPVGTPDGAIGPKSRAGIRNYQSYMGWQPTGYLEPYQKAQLLDSYNRVQAGAGGAYPEVVANEGVQGLLKAFADPNYVNRYRQAAAQPAQPVAPPAPQPVAPAPAPAPVANATPGVLPKLAPLPLITETSASMAERCEVVSLMTQTNQGLMKVSNLSDPDQALSEQFCEARSYAMTVGQTVMANVRLPEDQLVATCGQIATAMQPALDVAKTDAPATAAQSAAAINAQLGVSDVKAAATYGQICMGLGYRSDDADLALAGTMMLVGAGYAPYGEMIAHHKRENFGMPRDMSSAQQWYESALDALDANMSPAFLPSKSAERSAVIRAALEMGAMQANAAPGILPQIVPASTTLPAIMPVQ